MDRVTPATRRTTGLTRRAALAAAAAVVASGARAAAPVRVASKIDTEGSLLGSLILAALAQHGVPTEDKLQLGPTRIVREALLYGAIDLYPEYTGNGAFFFHQENDPVWKDRQAGWQRAHDLDLQQNSIVWLPCAPANNSWAIAVRQDVAKPNKLVSMVDFARWVNGGGNVLLAASAEFVESPAALPAFQAAYDFRLRDAQIVTLAGGNTAATLRAAAEGTSGVNAGMAYGTDGALSALAVVLMSDDKHAEPIYAPAPVVRQSVLDAYPAIALALAPVFAALNETTLQRLNGKIAVDGEEPKAVAAAFLATLK
jgi:osmoprotectant transport system substrate-binding protein